MTATDNALARMYSREALAELENRTPANADEARRMAQAAEYHRSVLVVPVATSTAQRNFYGADETSLVGENEDEPPF